jgi:hypothetical protein
MISGKSFQAELIPKMSTPLSCIFRMIQIVGMLGKNNETRTKRPIVMRHCLQRRKEFSKSEQTFAHDEAKLGEGGSMKRLHKCKI